VEIGGDEAEAPVDPDRIRPDLAEVQRRHENRPGRERRRRSLSGGSSSSWRTEARFSPSPGRPVSSAEWASRAPSSSASAKSSPPSETRSNAASSSRKWWRASTSRGRP
jgi:hypothetical protein